ncbi:MAG: hypothetical protein J7L88_04905 [Thermoplasmata archaeon]|nr:hypothetical protein [Thermoplasmata archaeon]
MSERTKKRDKRIKYFDEIIICDFCQNPHCPWKEYTISNPPRHCPEERIIYLSDPGEDVRNPSARERVAEKVGVYNHKKGAWVLSAPQALSLLPDELFKIIKKLNSFSHLNDLHLSEEIEYRDRMAFQTFGEDY